MTDPQIEQHPSQQGVFRLQSSLVVDRPIEAVFAFFSDARNLEQITPEWMQFQVVTPEPVEMHAGQLIDYRLRVHGIPLRWQSEITVWEPPRRFVDEQRRGPYRLWHHEHRFCECEGGTCVVDCVDYAVPGGRLIHELFVRRDLRSIFRFRTQQLHRLFDSPP